MTVIAAIGGALAYTLVARIENASRGAAQIDRAVCVFLNSDDGVSGNVILVRVGRGRTAFECSVSGLTPGLHGFHVHEAGDLREGCTSACSHYDPTGHAHGGPSGHRRHRGDLGNLDANAFGVCEQRIEAEVDLDEIVGRMLVIHADPDDLGEGAHTDSAQTGHSGRRIACGVIGRVAVKTPKTAA